MEAEISNPELRGKIESVLETCLADGFDPFETSSDAILIDLLIREGLIIDQQSALRTIRRVREFAPKIFNSVLQHNPESTYRNTFINCLVFGVAIANPKPANPEGPVKVLIGNGPIFLRFRER